MFTIYHSNQLDLLKSLTAQLLKRQPLSSVFAKETILVQSQGMGQWLQIQLAQELGISANIQYPFPAQFVWNIYRVFYPQLPKRNAFNTDFMTWALMAILPKLMANPYFVTLQHYINDNNEQRYYQLASNIAVLFDQYLVYRPDWIITWQEGREVNELGSEQQWQAELWRELVRYSKNIVPVIPHRTDIHQAVMKILGTKKLSTAQQAQLPERIFIFGIVSLPPLYLELFNLLSYHIDVHLMFMNPCRQYWGDIVDHSFVYKYIKNPQLSAMMLQNSHPLLASWGKLGRDHLALLQNHQKQDIEAFTDYDQLTLLTSIQQSILAMQTDSMIDLESITFNSSQHKQAILPHDNSLSLHSCHGEQREVEVLYDYLLAILDNNPEISLNDCVVMVADIDHYAPYIQSVFDNAPKNRRLPYTISDQKLRHIDPLIQGFFLLLDLPTNRLNVEYIFDLLEIPAIGKKFNLPETRLKQLQHWVIDSGIRFNLDSNSDEPHSWLSGLRRMLLGYVMTSNIDSWQDILPYDEATGLDAELIGFLADFIQAIAKWHGILQQNHTVIQWQELCWQLLTDFFVFDADSEPLLLTIQEHWQETIEQAILSDYQETISIIILSDILQAKFTQQSISHRFLIGKVNFCTLMPMRSVPFKIVCLLGMNEGVYPRVSIPIGFDLIQQHSRMGDRSRRNDDRYLFLEALLSAELQLYISYIGHDIQTNELRYPSILVDELLDYVMQHYLIDGDDELNTEQSSISLADHLITTHSRMPFNIGNYTEIHHQSISYADEWLPAAKRQGLSVDFITPLTLQSVQTVNLRDLNYFYFHSIKTLAQTRLGYFINYRDEQIENTEYFNLDSLQRYNINNQILDVLLPSNMSDEKLSQRLYNKILKSNQLPYGAFGQILYNDQSALIQPLINKVNHQLNGKLQSLDVNIPINNIQLTGRINNIQPDGILQWRSSKLTIKDGIVLWIEHLICSIVYADEKHKHNRIYGREDTRWCFYPVPKEQAFILLSQLIEGYINGINQPLFMPLQSSWHWLETAYNQETKIINSDPVILAKARTNFINCWQGSINLTGECDDYYLRLYPELTDELIDIAQQSATLYLLPIIQYRDIEHAD